MPQKKIITSQGDETLQALAEETKAISIAHLDKIYDAADYLISVINHTCLHVSITALLKAEVETFQDHVVEYIKQLKGTDKK